jgi:anti-anti-sigma regulatory factor
MRRRLSAVLDDVAAELGDLADSAQALQARLEDTQVLKPSGALDSTTAGALQASKREDLVVALQSLDYMTQALQCLARFVSGTARHVPVHCAPDLAAVLGSVSLSKLRLRLEHTSQAPAPEPEIELFDAA